MGVKKAVDEKVLRNQRMMDNRPYFSKEIMPTIIQSCRSHGVQPTLDQVRYIDACVAGEYFAERTWTT
jgi:type I restriction enzyme R subunit